VDADASASDPGDAGEEDGGPAESADAGVDAGHGHPDGGVTGTTTFDAGSPSRTDLPSLCAYLDDIDVALTGLHREGVWVTRLRSVLPTAALTEDLRLEPTTLPDGRADPDAVSNLHVAPYYDYETPAPSTGGFDKSACEGGRIRRRRPSGWAIVVASALFGVAWLRRRRRPEP
jgi:hypothetical protein